MHIAIDAHSVGVGLAGNESYITNLIEALAEIDSENRYTLYVTKDSAVSRFRDRWPNVQVRLTLPHTPLIRIPLTLSVELRRHPVDVLHVQFTSPPVAPCPVVATIHDLSFEHLPETFNRRSTVQLRLTVRHTAQRAAEIITISESSSRDLIETYKLDPDRITITPLAAGPQFRPITDLKAIAGAKQRHRTGESYILAVGSIQPRKNLVRLVEAYCDLVKMRGTNSVPNLVLAGKRAWLYEETVQSAGMSDVADKIIFTGYVPDADLPLLYNGAECLVYPSYFEGFGLPPLEAMQCGTPVIAGDRTSLPEVVGDAGLLVDPFSVDAIRTAIASVLDNPDFRSELSVKGLRRASMFSWHETARRTLGIYQRAYSSRSKVRVAGATKSDY